MTELQPEIADLESFCPVCHNLDLCAPVLVSESSPHDAREDQNVSSTLDRGSNVPSVRRATFSILGEAIQPGAQRLNECTYCSLLANALSKIDPALSVSQEWAGARITVVLSKGENISIHVKTQLPLPLGRRQFELYVPRDRGRNSYLPRHTWQASLGRAHLPCCLHDTGSNQASGCEYPFWRQGREIEDVDPVPGGERFWGHVTRWLSDCEANHPACCEARTAWNPRRLIRLDSDKVLRVIVTDEESLPSTEPLRYAALSHCWGRDEQPLRTLRANFNEHKTRIEPVRLSRVFQDAITTVRRLGMNYLWIDSLCIVQDDLDDWAEESQVMHKIFAQAHLTISATSCSDGTRPFLGPDALRQGPVSLFHHLRNKQPDQIIKIRGMPSKDEFEGPLMTRAWALQEQHFARRIIHFESLQSRWACKVACGQESDPILPPWMTHRLSVSIDKRVPWGVILQLYTNKALTNVSDRLPALSGIAADYASTIGSRYISGLWQGQLVRQMSWSRALTELRGPRFLEAEAASSLDLNKPPSWSWASLRGGVWANFISTLDWHDLVVASEVFCLPGTPNIFGAVRSGAFLRLTGTLFFARIVISEHEDGRTRDLYNVLVERRENATTLTLTMMTDCALSAGMVGGHVTHRWAGRSPTDDDNINVKNLKDAKVAVLPLGKTKYITREAESITCLVLGKQADFEDDVFQRIGLAVWALGEDEEWDRIAEDVQSRTIKLM